MFWGMSKAKFKKITYFTKCLDLYSASQSLSGSLQRVPVIETAFLNLYAFWARLGTQAKRGAAMPDSVNKYENDPRFWPKIEKIQRSGPLEILQKLAFWASLGTQAIGGAAILWLRQGESLPEAGKQVFKVPWKAYLRNGMPTFQFIHLKNLVC